MRAHPYALMADLFPSERGPDTIIR